MPRTGRPPSDDAKRGQYRLRMSSEDEKLLEYCCKATGKTKAEVIREGLRKVYEEIKA